MDLSIFLQQIPDSDSTWGGSLLSGLYYTLTVAFFAWILAFVTGSIAGVIRTTGVSWAVRLGNAYVELFRNIPLLVQFFIWYFVLPGLVPSVKVWVTGLDPTQHQLVTAILCLGFFHSSRMAELVKSGIMSLPRGQRYAGHALGLTEAQTYRYVLLPMAYRIVIPPLTSDTMSLIKNSSVAYSIGLVELFFRTREMGEITFRYFEAFGAATLIYIVIAMIANRVMALIEKRVRVPGYVGGTR